MTGELEAFLRGVAQQRPPRRAAPSHRAPSPSPGGPLADSLRGLTPLPPDEESRTPLTARDALGTRVGPQHLAADVDLADERMEAHLHGVFDHEVGSLSADASPVASEAVGLADLLAGMLLRPASLRQAILLGEVLRRPVERWE